MKRIIILILLITQIGLLFALVNSAKEIQYQKKLGDVKYMNGYCQDVMGRQGLRGYTPGDDCDKYCYWTDTIVCSVDGITFPKSK